MFIFFLVVTIPFSIASFRLGTYALWPFGRTVVPDPDAGAGSAIGNISGSFWPVFGWRRPGACGGVLLCITIIGIPFGIASFKMAGLALFPLGKRIVSIEG